ncbi:NACHT domain-containing protein [Elizabethkingia anophelis]|uniref:NACHT domain-containing protein n=1 Tax=Elizabethkingia anophelis TaxID=1117645 RepID=UPI00099A96CE|nr:NACHT domain-containing protein [Elizabethkingia anophelis]OPC47305.1 hypothetical protein BAY05_08460 [Elizabethkingia anophelis]
MVINLDCSKYLKKINKKEVIKNLFDFNLGSVLAEVVDFEMSIETKAFLLLFNASRSTNEQMAKAYGREQLNSTFDLVLISKQMQKEYKDFLEQNVVLKKGFFENILQADNSYLIASYNLFKKFSENIEIPLPLDIRSSYYINYRENIKNEYQNNKDRYQELVNFFDNPLSLQNDKLALLLSKYDEFKNFYTIPLQQNSECKETLEDLYIEPLFSVFENNLVSIKEDDHFNKFHLYSEKKTIHDFFSEYFLKGNKNNKLKENYDMAFVLGQPGQGKTSFCYKLIHDYLESHSDLPPVPIIFLKIRELVAKDFINNPFEEIGRRFHFMDFNEDEFILIIDGLDEAYMSGGITDSDLRNLYERLKKRVNKKIKIVLTSRFNYLNTGDSCLDGTLILQLNELTDKQIINYCSNFKKFHPENLLINKIELIIGNEQYRHIRELLRQAVLIYFIAISNIDIDERDSKTKIYDKIFDSLAQRSWDSNGQLDYFNSRIKSDVNLYKRYLKEYIRNIAFEIYQSPKLFITVKKLLELESTKLFVKRCFQKDLFSSEEQLQEISKYLLISFYFQQTNKSSSETALEFFHNSLWEYLTAEFFWEENKKILLQKDEYEELKTICKEDYFVFLNKIVGNKAFGSISSISQNLIEIIEVEDNDIKREVYEQSKDCFYELLKVDFLLEFQYKKDGLTAIEKSQQLFNVFWSFIHECCVNCQELSFVFFDENLNYLFDNSGGFLIFERLFNTVIAESSMNSKIFVDSYLYNVLFDSGICVFDISHSYFVNICFKNIYLTRSLIQDNDFENIVFEECQIKELVSFADNDFRDIKMNNVEILDKSWYNEFIKHNNFDKPFEENHKIETRIEENHNKEKVKKFYIVYEE